MRKFRRKIVFLPLLLILTLIVLTVIGLNYYYILQKLSYDNAQIDYDPQERVRISDVLSVQNFIKDVTPVSSFAHTYSYPTYNNKRSDQLGAFRALPDTRDTACSARSYRIPSAAHAKVSIIIAFHNELRSTLIRTIMSVYRRTPSKYLHEIILVDDCSEDVSLLAALYQLNFPPFTVDNNYRVNASSLPTTVVKSQRNSHRLGLIESRNLGARLASGVYLIFLDSHCEVNVGWLEPLLERAATAGKIAVSPVLDSIDAFTLEYRASSTHLMGGFDWNLHFHWISRGEKRMQGTDEQAFRSPTFSGGIFMISRNWFFKLNAFNSLLEIWGGEAIEFSIKLWLCGGQIEIVPCSRVGHIFRRQHSFDFPHSDGQTTYLRNSKIIAESWLDAYKYFFYASKPAAKQLSLNISSEALTQHKPQPEQLLQCCPFAWYLQHVYPELKLPNDDFIAFGALSVAELCLQILKPLDVSYGATNSFNSTDLNTSSPRLLMLNCYRSDITHWYLHRQSSRLHSSTGACLNVVQTQSNNADLISSTSSLSSSKFNVVLQYCRSSAQTQRWMRRGAQLIHADTHLCLDNPLGDVVAVTLCRRDAPSQLFRFAMEVQQL